MFKIFNVQSTAGIVGAVAVFLVLTMAYEGFKCLRLNIAEHQGNRPNGLPMLSRAHVIQTGLFMAEMLFSYVIMLSVMTYNAWMFVAVVTGSAAGNLLCQLLRKRHSYKYFTTVVPPGDKAKVSDKTKSHPESILNNGSLDKSKLSAEALMREHRKKTELNGTTGVEKHRVSSCVTSL